MSPCASVLLAIGILAGTFSYFLTLAILNRRQKIRLDGLMVNGNEILFSIAPIDLDGGGITNNAGDIDGGEIFYWSGVNGQPASFLFHGGHLWDTAFGVQNTYDTPSENINALEAVATTPVPTPEPAALMGLLTVGGLGLLSYRKKQN